MLRARREKGISALEAIIGILLLTSFLSIGIIIVEWIGDTLKGRGEKSRAYFDGQRKPLMQEEELVVERDINGGYVVTYKTG